MIITELHLKFYRQKKCTPSFMDKIQKLRDAPVSIDDLINSQNSKKNNKEYDLDNAISLLKLVRSNQENEPRKNSPYYEGIRTLKEYMEKCNCPKRGKYYLRWVRKMNSGLQ